MTRKPRKNPLKEVGDHHDKMTMRAHQRAAFKRNDALAQVTFGPWHPEDLAGVEVPAKRGEM